MLKESTGPKWDVAWNEAARHVERDKSMPEAITIDSLEELQELIPHFPELAKKLKKVFEDHGWGKDPTSELIGLARYKKALQAIEIAATPQDLRLNIGYTRGYLPEKLFSYASHQLLEADPELPKDAVLKEMLRGFKRQQILKIEKIMADYAAEYPEYKQIPPTRWMTPVQVKNLRRMNEG